MSEQLREIRQERRCLFISDVHLGGFSTTKNTKIEDDLLALLKYAVHEKLEIIVLGDLFDYWMEIRGYVPKVGKRIRDWFKNHHQKSNTKGLFITGNHDNWTENHLNDDLGFDLEHEFRIENIEGKKTLLMHGDGLQSEEMNFKRPRFHRFLRNPYFIAVYKRMLPAVSAVWLMKQFSRFSRATSDDGSPADIRLESWSRNQLEKQRFDAIICGHSHKCRFEIYNSATYMNLGNFYSDRTVGLYANGTFGIARWVAEENQLITRTI